VTEINSIRELLEQYFHAIDSRDEQLLTSCFTADATALYHKGFVTQVSLVSSEGIARFLLKRTSVYSATTHLIGNTRIQVKDNTACTAMFSVANCVVANEPKILVRGIRYEDNLVRSDEAGWLIKDRVHIPQWQYEVASVLPAIPTRE